ncbi:MAG: ATP-dependent protease ATPase subunit HslU [Planctomycetaceae bacterium]
MRDMTPRQIVAELDKHIVGQDAAKRAVAIALRNRWRWQQLPEDVRRDITPKNILMIGPTGVGKTEITRRLAQLIGSPFVKVEATRFTEVGYVGRDVESMIRELVDASINLVKQRKRTEVEQQAGKNVEERLLDLLIPHEPLMPVPSAEDQPSDSVNDAEAKHERTREKFRTMLRSGSLEDKQVELTVPQRRMPVQVFSNMGLEQMDVDFQQMFEKLMPRQHKDRKVTVKEARLILMEQEVEQLLDKDAIHEEGLRLAEDSGIVFLDEIDKICGESEGRHGADVSRQGVQRDLLPIVEGATVQTRYGSLKTDHILFIAAGAFHSSRPADLMPELQGRFPIRVELKDLTKADFLRILTEPSSSITRQSQDLLRVDGIELFFTQDGLAELAEVCWRVNQSTQNIGARRLYTVMERLLENVSYEGPDSRGAIITIDRAFVRGQLEEISQDEDLSKFIL